VETLPGAIEVELRDGGNAISYQVRRLELPAGVRARGLALAIAVGVLVAWQRGGWAALVVFAVVVTISHAVAALRSFRPAQYALRFDAGPDGWTLRTRHAGRLDRRSGQQARAQWQTVHEGQPSLWVGEEGSALQRIGAGLSWPELRYLAAQMGAHFSSNDTQ
jgi:hypothetical protein